MVWEPEAATGPAFDIALWGYDRQQVDACLDELTTRLEAALTQQSLVETLQIQLIQARLEIDRLRQRPADPAWNDRLAAVMAAAEQLRDQAAQEADAARAGDAPATPAMALPTAGSGAARVGP